MEMKEYFIDAPWGKVAYLAWGDSNNKPVFLCHGAQDSAITFEPLVKLLPSDYYYVAIDLPGNGRSDSLAPGLPLVFAAPIVPAVSLTIDYLKWKKFVFIGHSLGTAIGDLYNTVWPGRIQRMIHLDPLAVWINAITFDHVLVARERMELHYRNYSKEFSLSPKTYTRHEAVALVQKARGLTPEAARLATERNLVPAEDDKFRLCWEQRAKWPIILGLSKEYYIDTLARSRTPMLVLEASIKWMNGFDYLSHYMKSRILSLNPLNRWGVIEGNHDFHLCVPSLVAPQITSFLRMSLEDGGKEDVKCKL